MNKQSMYDIVIIGAGPAGISLGAEAVTSGIPKSKVLILEKAQEHSWSIRKFYPDEKLVTANYKGVDASCKGVMCLLDSSKDETLTYLDKAIADFDLNIFYRSEVYEIEKLKSGYYIVKSNTGDYVTKTIAIAIGVLGKPNKPSYPIPAQIKPIVYFDVTTNHISKSDVLVVGGGDSASEYVQYLVEKGNNVTFSYRREEITRMNQINMDSLYALAKEGKVTLKLGTDIDSIEPCDGAIKVNFKNDEPLIFEHIVYALGGTSPKAFLQGTGIKMTKEGPEVSSFFESSQEGIFLLGDISAGNKGGSINSAFNSAHDAMEEVCRNYLDCRI
jgi:thioredoxin reductase (NADPH)